MRQLWWMTVHRREGIRWWSGRRPGCRSFSGLALTPDEALREQSAEPRHTRDAGVLSGRDEPAEHGQSVAALAKQYGGLNNAAAALGYSDVSTLQSAIMTFCEG